MRFEVRETREVLGVLSIVSSDQRSFIVKIKRIVDGILGATAAAGPSKRAPASELASTGGDWRQDEAREVF